MSKIISVIAFAVFLLSGSVMAKSAKHTSKKQKQTTIIALREKWTVFYGYDDLNPVHNFDVLRINSKLYIAVPIEDYFSPSFYKISEENEKGKSLILSKDDDLWKASSEYQYQQAEQNYQDLNEKYQELLTENESLKSQISVQADDDKMPDRQLSNADIIAASMTADPCYVLGTGRRAYEKLKASALKGLIPLAFQLEVQGHPGATNLINVLAQSRCP